MPVTTKSVPFSTWIPRLRRRTAPGTTGAFADTAPSAVTATRGKYSASTSWRGSAQRGRPARRSTPASRSQKERATSTPPTTTTATPPPRSLFASSVLPTTRRPTASRRPRPDSYGRPGARSTNRRVATSTALSVSSAARTATSPTSVSEGRWPSSTWAWRRPSTVTAELSFYAN
jgi:hypothetical protein